ncbi:MAG: ASPIC/UnbV domain-containing protein, partial [Bacteroidota bacterium]
DGDLDVLIPNMDASLFFYENNIIGEDPHHGYHWAKIELEGTLSNRDGLGSKLSVYCADTVQHRYFVGAGFLNQSLKPIHLGLGGADQIDSLIITWPSGTVEKYERLPANVSIRLTEQQGFSLEEHQANKVRGCTDPKSCTYNPAAVIDDGSCVYLPKLEISGIEQADCLAEAIYTYPGAENSEYVWKIEGGEIVSGQGRREVKVKWGLAKMGKLEVTEIQACQPEEAASLAVELSLKPERIDLGVARLWNEALLAAIRQDFARPTVHARNLFHVSIAMYDAWAVFDEVAQPYLLGRTLGNYRHQFAGFSTEEPVQRARDKALSFAAYRLLHHRFKDSPGRRESLELFDWVMVTLGYDPSFEGIDYQSGDAAALGNFVAQSIIQYGLQDGSNEQAGYRNRFYSPVNPPLVVEGSGNPRFDDPNRWQPLAFESFIDQSGNPIQGRVPEFLSPEWGKVYPFSLAETDRQVYARNGAEYWVYQDPGPPPLLDSLGTGSGSDDYRWGFGLVSVWGAHLDPQDSVQWDISPGGIGNLGPTRTLPRDYADYPDFYQRYAGGDPSSGHALNPYTGQPYEPQWVPRGDYARVLAEFWADGPDSETPPGHWFVLLNEVSDHPDFDKQWNGQGEAMDPLEWEVKSYFVLGGAMHDAAISAWSIKGWYDYLRPISAIRYLAALGQSSDPNLPSYHPAGIPLEEDYVELVGPGDELAGARGQHVGKIKVKSWRGHRYIRDPETDQAGVGWILADDWMPYQRPSFVTPPFAGYVSGHSTYSRAAAEVMTLITGDPYFPGGMGEFVAPKNQFLVFEEGPSQDVTLQWATYRDASDQCSLSRIWGGIHPPADDLPGRIIGERVGQEAYRYALPYFEGEVALPKPPETLVFPNPLAKGERLRVLSDSSEAKISLYDQQGRQVEIAGEYLEEQACWELLPAATGAGLYFLQVGDQVMKVWIR